MSRRESATKTERIVGTPRHETEHLGRAVSAEQRVYVLHSVECKRSTPDLRDCDYSIALDQGIDLIVWGEWQDMPVLLTIDDEVGDLVPQHWPRIVEPKSNDSGRP